MNDYSTGESTAPAPSSASILSPRSRSGTLHQYRFLETLPEAAFEDLAQLAADVCATPIAFITLGDADQQWLKAQIGLELPEHHRIIPFYTETIANTPSLLVIPDTLQNERIRTSELVASEPYIRFYAGAPLVTPEGLTLGMLCVLDSVPREINAHQRAALTALSRSIITEIELRRLSAETVNRQHSLYTVLHQLGSELDADVIIHKAVQAIQQLQRWQSISISLPSADGASWQTRAEAQQPHGHFRKPLSMQHGVIGRTYRTGVVQHAPNVHNDPDFFQAEGVAPINSELAVPILFDCQVLGVINLESEQLDAFTTDDITFAQSIAELLAIALKNAQRFTAMQQESIKRAEIEAALRRSEELYRGLIQSLDSFIVIIDQDGGVRYVNDTAAQHLSLPPEHIIGRTLFDFFATPIAAAQLEHIRRVITTDCAIVAEVPSLVHEHLHWYRTSIQPIHDEHGNAVYALVNATDIDDLKNAQYELLQLNETLEEQIIERTAEIQDLYDNAPTGYHSLDTNGCFMRINQTHLDWLGYTREELIGRPFGALLTEASRAVFAEHFVHFKKQGILHDAEYDLVRKDGSSFPVIYSATAIYNDQGHFVLSRSTLFDHTERKKAESVMQLAHAEMERALRTKDEFLATMSHELRTPLNAILALSESLLEGIDGELAPRQHESLKHIEASGYHLLALINDILDLSKVEAGHLDLQYDSLLIADICRSSIQMVREMAIKKRLHLSVALDDELAEMEADAKRLKQMLVNLLSNAIKFTPSGGRVQLVVGIDPVTAMVAFTVHDTGIGIAPDAMQRLFQPFTQLDSRLSRQHEGTGLGLVLVRRLAQLHGGDVTVQSTPGSGSSFTISLPHRIGTVAPAAPPAAETLQSHRRTNIALVVEDSLSTTEQLTRYLQELQMRTVIHPQGASVVELATGINPDVILLDLLMPDQSGWEVLRQLKADPRTKAIPVILVTIVDERRSGLDAGAAEYLVKPISRDLLQAAIANTIGLPDEPVQAAPPEESTLMVSSRTRLLLAEDNEVNLEVIRDYLQNKGYQVVVAHNGSEALEQTALHEPHLIIMDIQMPHMDGLEAIRQLRAAPRYAATPIIALTALAMPNDRERCLAAGASAYLSKPVSLRGLATTIEQLLTQ